MNYNYLKTEDLVDSAVDCNLPPSIYFTMWNELASWQFDILLNQNLTNNSYVLDIGCGALRAGLSLINFLNDGHYCGIDSYQKYIELGHSLAKKHCPDKSYDLICNDNLDFAQFNKKFDFAICQSVFTHLSNTDIQKCFNSLLKVMNPGGKLIFTYLVNTTHTRGFLYGGTQTMERSTIDDDSFFEKLAKNLRITFSKLDYKHPTGQSVGLCQF